MRTEISLSIFKNQLRNILFPIQNFEWILIECTYAMTVNNNMTNITAENGQTKLEAINCLQTELEKDGRLDGRMDK